MLTVWIGYLIKTNTSFWGSEKFKREKSDKYSALSDNNLDTQNKTEKEGPKVLLSFKTGPTFGTLPLFILPGI